MKIRKIRYAVVGQGHIAQVAVLPAFAQSKNSELTALVSGDSAKLKALCKKYRVDHSYSYDEYDQLLQSGHIDAVYIALPNSMHKDFAVRAAHAGIHVLCEKPLTVQAKDSEAIIRAARQSRVKLMVAYRLHFDPANLHAIQIAHSGRIGEPRYFTSDFGYQIKDRNIRMEPKEGGSPLNDIGIYCINAARYIFKADPTEVFAFAANPDKRFGKIHESVSATLRFPEERIATFTCSFGSAAISNYRVVGTKGDLFMDNAYEYVGKVSQRITVKGKSKEQSFKAGDQFAAELEYFSNCVLRNREPEPSGDEGLIDVRIIEALMKSIATGKPVSLSHKLPRKVRRPTRVQEIRKPAHAEPELVKVSAAPRDDQ